MRWTCKITLGHQELHLFSILETGKNEAASTYLKKGLCYTLFSLKQAVVIHNITNPGRVCYFQVYQACHPNHHIKPCMLISSFMEPAVATLEVQAEGAAVRPLSPIQG